MLPTDYATRRAVAAVEVSVMTLKTRNVVQSNIR